MSVSHNEATQPVGTPGPPSGEPSPSRAPELITSRGWTTISPKVVQKIAQRAAEEVDGVGGVKKSGLTRLVPFSIGDPSVQASADVAQHERASVDLSIAVRYPDPVAEVADRVRRRVVERVQELTGLAVTAVNITVPELTLGGGRSSRPRVV